MPWASEDWRRWLPADRDEEGVGIPHDFDCAVKSVLERVPGGETLRVAQLGCREPKHLPYLAGRVDRASLDLVMVLEGDGDSVANTDALLRQGHESLVEGGILLVGVQASSRQERATPVVLGARTAGPSGWHEFELQYRLRCAGYQGVRVARFEQRLLAMAVRRASN